MGGFLKVTPRMCPARGSGLRDTEPILGIPKTGVMTLNRTAVAAFELDKRDQVQLFWDAHGKRIGLKPGGFTSTESRDAFQLYRPKDGVLRIPGSSGFLAYCGIERDESRRYVLKRDENTGLLVADLNQPLPGRTAKRGGK